MLTVPVVGGISTGQPTPWAGVIERINIFMDMQWVAVLSIALLCCRKEAEIPAAFLRNQAQRQTLRGASTRGEPPVPKGD